MTCCALLYGLMFGFILFALCGLGWFFFSNGGIVDSVKEDLRNMRERP